MKWPSETGIHFNPNALRKAKIVCNFGLSECNRVKERICFPRLMGEQIHSLKSRHLFRWVSNMKMAVSSEKPFVDTCLYISFVGIVLAA